MRTQYRMKRRANGFVPSASRNTGFTLLELLIVLALMTIITSIVVPQFSRSMTGLQLQKTTREIAAVLNEARNTAITESREVAFKFDAANKSYASTATNLTYAWPGHIEVTFESAQSGFFADSINEVVFRPDGSATGARLVLSTAGKSYFILIDWITGQVHVET